jgi:hypothetical protein
VTQSREDCRQLDEGGGPASNSEMHQARRRPGARAPRCVPHAARSCAGERAAPRVLLLHEGGLPDLYAERDPAPRWVQGRGVCPGRALRLHSGSVGPATRAGQCGQAYQSASVRLCAAVAVLPRVPAQAPGGLHALGGSALAGRQGSGERRLDSPARCFNRVINRVINRACAAAGRQGRGARGRWRAAQPGQGHAGRRRGCRRHPGGTPPSPRPGGQSALAHLFHRCRGKLSRPARTFRFEACLVPVVPASRPTIAFSAPNGTTRLACRACVRGAVPWQSLLRSCRPAPPPRALFRPDGRVARAAPQRVRGLLRETEAGVRALQRSRQWREAARASQGQALPQAVRDQLSFPVALPSPFLRASVRGFHVRARAARAARARAELGPVLTDLPCGRGAAAVCAHACAPAARPPALTPKAPELGWRRGRGSWHPPSAHVPRQAADRCSARHPDPMP